VRERERDRQIDRQTDRQREKQTEKAVSFPQHPFTRKKIDNNNSIVGRETRALDRKNTAAKDMASIAGTLRWKIY
jgi:hypothetical protein